MSEIVIIPPIDTKHPINRGSDFESLAYVILKLRHRVSQNRDFRRDEKSGKEIKIPAEIVVKMCLLKTYKDAIVLLKKK